MNLEGQSCSDGAGGAGGEPAYAECEVLGSHKVYGP